MNCAGTAESTPSTADGMEDKVFSLEALTDQLGNQSTAWAWQGAIKHPHRLDGEPLAWSRRGPAPSQVMARVGKWLAEAMIYAGRKQVIPGQGKT